MTTIGKPKIDKRSKQTYMGNSHHCPLKGMSKAGIKLGDKETHNSKGVEWI